MSDKPFNKRLYYKMASEFEKYKLELMNLTSEEILRHAYAYCVKQDILLFLEDRDITEQKAKALLQYDNPLDVIFNNWENTESGYWNEIQNTIESVANENIECSK